MKPLSADPVRDPATPARIFWPRSLDLAVKQAARSQGISMSEWVRQAMAEKLTGQTELLEAMRRQVPDATLEHYMLDHHGRAVPRCLRCQDAPVSPGWVIALCDGCLENGVWVPAATA